MKKKSERKTVETTTQAMKKKVNRTGIAMSPIDGKQLVDGAQDAIPTPGSANEVAAFRLEKARTAEPLGSVPPPASIKGAAKTAIDALKGTDASTLLDKLGARLAFERTGTRLYDQLLVKLQAYGGFVGGPSEGEIMQIREEERAHAALVTEAIETLGADPTAMTPSADLVGVQGLGLVQSMGDPRVSLGMALESVLIAELTDRDGWELLIEMVRSAGHTDIADRFAQALAAEERHLAWVRGWVTAHASIAAGTQAIDEAAE